MKQKLISLISIGILGLGLYSAIWAATYSGSDCKANDNNIFCNTENSTRKRSISFPTTNTDNTDQDRHYSQGIDAYARGDYAQAKALFELLVQQGYAPAQYGLGVMYEKGRGVAQDLNQASAYYEKAAEHGYASAQYNLALMYIGKGVIQDYTKARTYYEQAAKQGYAIAQYNLGLIYGIAKDYSKARAYFNQAA